MLIKKSKLFKLLKINNGPSIISELGINHFGSLKIAKKMVDEIFKNGGRIVKNQSHDLASEMSKEAKNVKPANAKMSIYNVIKENMMSQYLSSPLHPGAMRYYKEVGLIQ